MTELLSPAGDIEKLETAFAYGADAVYVGLKDFSLRARAGNLGHEDIPRMKAAREACGGKIYGALNIFFHQNDIEQLESQLNSLADYPLDGFIVSDLGAAALLKKAYPERALHLSTQANCLNSHTVRVCRDLGFSRIILGREASIDDIRRIKDAVPEMELEAFVHGAMCMAYSGRCFLSAHLTGRSANRGDCAHTCRWDYSLALEEKERPGVYFPVAEDENGLSVLSSRDLCMIDHLAQLKDAGITSFKIEGRMKSLLYVATVTRAYRKALDALTDPAVDWKPYRDELDKVSHRQYSTGFFFGSGPVDDTLRPDSDSPHNPAPKGYRRGELYVGRFVCLIKPGIWQIDIRNQIAAGGVLEYVGPDVLSLTDTAYRPLNAQMEAVEHIDHCQVCYLATDAPVKPGYLIRRPL